MPIESDLRKHSRREQAMAHVGDTARRIARGPGALPPLAQGGGRHDAPFRAARDVLLAAAGRLGARAAAIDVTGDAGGVHAACRHVTHAAVALERLWSAVADTMTQRTGDSPHAALLRAADEVAWSCYRPVIRGLPPSHPAHRHAVVPLAALGDAALPPGASLLPLATVRLPAHCVSGPWWMVTIAREVAHHLCQQLELDAHVADGIHQCASGWQAWGPVLFADAFWVYTAGPWAIWALAEAHWDEPAALQQASACMPAPALRLAVMTSLARRAGMDVPRAPVAPSAQPVALIEAVAAFLEAPLPGQLGRLQDLCAFEPGAFADGGKVQCWAEGLRADEPVEPSRNINDARHMASAAVSAWMALSSDADPHRREHGRQALQRAATRAVRDCAEPLTRTGTPPEWPREAPERLAALLMDLPVADLP